MKKIFLKILPMVAAFMKFSPEAKEPLNFSAEDKQKLDDHTKIEGFASEFMAYYNDNYLKSNEDAMQAFGDFMSQLDSGKPSGSEGGDSDDSDSDDSDDSDSVVPTGDVKTLAEALKSLISKSSTLLKTNEQQAADLAKLKKEPEPDVPKSVIHLNPNRQDTVKHSATHLFSSNQRYDSLERPWNKNLVDALKKGVNPAAATVWDKVNIDKLNSDLGAYARRNSNEIMDLLMDGYDIPAHWSVISNVQDEFVFASIVSGQITQGFKKAYLPKNKQRFIAIKNKIFDKQIDGEWQSSELKSIEKSWLNQFFNEGSTPYKESFAGYLISKLLNQARKEDKISIFKAVYSDPELQPGVPGDFLNSMSGFLKIIKEKRNVLYKAHDLDILTPANTYSVLTEWCKEKLPVDIRNSPLKLGLGNDVHRWYVDGRESSKGTIVDYEKNTAYIEDMPNIEFVKHPQLEGTGFVYITVDDNIGLMIDRPGEDSLITLEKAARAIKFFADWKLGVFFKAFGANIDPNAEVNYSDQIFFSNNVPLLTDVYVPVEANDATPSVSEHYALKIGGNNTSATDITNFDDAVDGQYVYLYCDDASNAPKIKHGTNILLATGADFTMAKGDKLVLVYSNSKFIEYSRTVALEVSLETKVTLAADATTADAADGVWFITQDNTGATAITDISNAVIDEEYTIEGGSNTNSTTIASSGNFLLSASFTASLGAKLTVKYNGSKFVETSRS